MTNELDVIKSDRTSRYSSHRSGPRGSQVFDHELLLQTLTAGAEDASSRLQGAITGATAIGVRGALCVQAHVSSSTEDLVESTGNFLKTSQETITEVAAAGRRKLSFLQQGIQTELSCGAGMASK